MLSWHEKQGEISKEGIVVDGGVKIVVKWDIGYKLQEDVQKFYLINVQTKIALGNNLNPLAAIAFWIWACKKQID